MNANAGEEHRSFLWLTRTIIYMNDLIIELRLLVLGFAWMLADFAFWQGVFLKVSIPSILPFLQKAGYKHFNNPLREV